MIISDELTLDAGDRLLVLAPHPDDETIATGGVIQKALASGLPVRVVYLTYGDNAETSFMVYRRRPLVRGTSVQQMGLLRHDEAVAACNELGLRSNQLTFLGYPDFRTLAMWAEHWGDAEPCMSMFTRTSIVPYANALRPGTPYRAEELLTDIEGILHDFKPTKVFLSHPADHNPDHLSLYLFTRVALWNLDREIQPTLHPALVHHPGWPQPAGLNLGLSLEPPGRLQKDAAWWVNRLTPDQVERKVDALRKHQTQYKMSASYLNSFMRTNELFGDLAEPMLQPGSVEAFREGAAASSAQGAAGLIAETLTNAERAKWIGVERRAVWLEDGCVVVAVDFSRPLGTEVGATMYLFGYRPDRPFAQMPKLQVHFTEFKSAVQDGPRKLPKDSIGLARGLKGFVLRAPLALLGEPRWLMGSVRTYFRKMPLDWIAWRIVGVPPAASTPSGQGR